MAEDLPNKPLVEALLEVKWVPRETQRLDGAGGLQVWTDPGYPLFLGILYEALKTDFPYVEDLPAKQMPDEITPGIIKTRFRKGQNEWPLVQAGPGILAVNFTTSYSWEVFLPTAIRTFEEFLRAYSTSQQAPRVTSVMLRYVDAIETAQFGEMDTLTFLREMLHTGVDLPPSIAHSPSLSGPLRTLDLRLSFPLNPPNGTGSLRVATGLKSQSPAIIMESSVTSADTDVPQTPSELSDWAESAHSIINEWFFAMIEGRLLEVFRGDG